MIHPDRKVLPSGKFATYCLLCNQAGFFIWDDPYEEAFFIEKMPKHQHLLGGIGYGKNEDAYGFKRTDKGSIQEFPFVEEGFWDCRQDACHL